MKNKASNLAKLLSTYGIFSRRQTESKIKEGRIKINTKIASLKDRCYMSDNILVDGKPLRLSTMHLEPSRVIIYNKKCGEICTRKDPQGRKIVFNSLRSNLKRTVMVGRLDINSSGLLLFTNDGELACRLMHPSYQISRNYMVRVFGKVTENEMERFKLGFQLKDGMNIKFGNINLVKGKGLNKWFRVELKQGKNREIRKAFSSIGCKVSKLVRVSYGGIKMSSNLSPGKFRELTSKEVIHLQKITKMKSD